MLITTIRRFFKLHSNFFRIQCVKNVWMLKNIDKLKRNCLINNPVKYFSFIKLIPFVFIITLNVSEVYSIIQKIIECDVESC